MKKYKFQVFTAFLFFVCFSIGGCSRPTAETTVLADPLHSLSADASDPKLSAALKVIEKNPDAVQPYLALAGIYIAKARRTGDFGLNANAENAVERGLKVGPNDFTARKLKASLDLTYHRFAEALELGTQLQKENPSDAFVYGVLTDANVELGNYDTAVEMAQKMVDLRPNSASYARVAHIRSLNGDQKGAVEMFKLAARTADPSDFEAQSWCLVQLGDELWKYGKYAEAEAVYDEALQMLPDYYLAAIGKGRARASQNDLPSAVDILTKTSDRIPNVEAFAQLGDIYSKLGDAEKAKQNYATVEVVEAKIGVNNDQKRLALMWANNGERLDDALAIAVREHGLRRDINTADTLAWTLFKLGRYAEARPVIAEALRLRSNEARILYHSGMIEKALGNASTAKQQLSQALKLNPEFDLIQSDVARKALSEYK